MVLGPAEGTERQGAPRLGRHGQVLQAQRLRPGAHKLRDIPQQKYVLLLEKLLETASSPALKGKETTVLILALTQGEQESPKEHEF